MLRLITIILLVTLMVASASTTMVSAAPMVAAALVLIAGRRAACINKCSDDCGGKPEHREHTFGTCQTRWHSVRRRLTGDDEVDDDLANERAWSKSVHEKSDFRVSCLDSSIL